MAVLTLMYINKHHKHIHTHTYTYVTQVCRMANVLLSLGVKKGDPVAIYLPMVVELPMTMLACARIGAIHSVIFGGFSSESLAGRILDSKCRVIVTADGVMRGAKPIMLKEIADEVRMAVIKTHAYVILYIHAHVHACNESDHAQGSR